MDVVELGHRIYLKRKEKNMSQMELANKTGIAQSTLSYIEKGEKNPTFITISMICEGLSIGLLELLSEEIEISHVFKNAKSTRVSRINLLAKIEQALKHNNLNSCKNNETNISNNQKNALKTH